MKKQFDHVIDVTHQAIDLQTRIILSEIYKLKTKECLSIYTDCNPDALYKYIKSHFIGDFLMKSKQTENDKWIIYIFLTEDKMYSPLLSELVIQDYRNAEVFIRHRLDFCCGGNVSLMDTCLNNGLNYSIIMAELSAIKNTPRGFYLPYEDWPLNFLCDYIVLTHHAYIRKQMPLIMNFVYKLAAVHGKEHSELIMVRELADKLKSYLESHIVQEEKVLFTEIKNILDSVNTSETINTLICKSVYLNSQLLQDEHEQIVDFLSGLREVTSDYLIPEDACGSYRYLYKLMEEFERDLFTHIHVENNILFPGIQKLVSENYNPELCVLKSN